MDSASYYVLLVLGVIIGAILLVAGTFIFGYYIFTASKRLRSPYSVLLQLLPEGCIYHSYKTNTEDGYILNLIRVHNPAKLRKAKRPIILQHGFGGSAFTWLISGK